MDPLRDTEFSLRFAAQASPWWLVLLVPAALALAWYLGRGRYDGVTRSQARILLGLRLVVILVLVVLLFRPSLVLREILTWPGRVVVLVDDSASMGVADTRLDAGEALALGRSLGLSRTPAPLAEAALTLSHAADGLHRLSRIDPADEDRFWNAVESSREAVRAAVDGLDDQILARIAEDLAASVREGRARAHAEAATVFAGSPGFEALIGLAAGLEDLALVLHQAQAIRDRQELPDPDVVTALRQRTRLDLARAALDRGEEGPSGLVVERQGLGGSQAAPGPAQGGSDLPGALTQILDQEHPCPLAAVILVSDGRSTTTPLASAAEAYAQAGVPILAIQSGSVQAPDDVVLARPRIAPFVAKDAPLMVNAVLHARVDAPAHVTVTARSGDQDLASTTCAIPSGASQHPIALEVRFAEVGNRALSLIASTLPGEASSANNRIDTLVEVRERPVRVLLVDGKPRWQSRYVASLFARLPQVVVDAIHISTQDGGILKRGEVPGTWPATHEALAGYDLVILGDLSQDTLSTVEWQDLHRLVHDQGRGLVFLASNDPLPAGLASIRDDFGMGAAVPAATEGLLLSAAGALAQVTRSWKGAVDLAGQAAVDARAGERVLAQDAAGRPLVRLAACGSGRIAHLGVDALWRHLHPTGIEDHAATWMSLLAWVLRAPSSDQTFAVDRSLLTTGDGLLVWAAPGSEVSIADGSQTVATHVAEACGDGSGSGYAWFDTLPEGRLEVRNPGREPHIIHVFPDPRELLDLSADHGALSDLASASGGRALPLARVDEIWDRLPQRERQERNEEVWRLWDSLVIFSLLLGLLALEWTWRKFAGLV